MSRTGMRARGEQGQVIVLWAAAMVPMLMVVALVVDVAQVRLDRRQNRSVADAAASAGAAQLSVGPWSGVCRARSYLLSNDREFSSFDAGSTVWSNAAIPPTTLATDPCVSPPASPTPCSPNMPSTWAKLSATAGGGRVTVEIQSGYALPDPRFAEDSQIGDGGDTSKGSCDNISVIMSEHRAPRFAVVGGSRDLSSRIRSVSRLNTTVTLDYVAALQLLEQHKCGVLQTGGTNTRVVVQPFGDHPGIIQVDSADDAGSCPQPIINAQATSGGPSVVACSTSSSLSDCTAGTGTRPSRIGVYAMTRGRPAADMATSFPTTYGDTAAVPSPQSGRTRADTRYRQNVAALDAKASSVLAGANGNKAVPYGCALVVSNACTDSAGRTWLVLQPTDCNSLSTFFPGGTTPAQNIWFNCDLNVGAPLTLTAPNSYVVVTGQLAVSSAFNINDAATIFVGGVSAGHVNGVKVSGGSLNVNNNGSTAPCGNATGHPATIVVGDRQFSVASGAAATLCQTFVYLASGFGHVPTTDGTAPCQTAACTGYNGTLSVSSGAAIYWSAPNQISGRQPTDTELATTNPYEDLSLWTEAGGNNNGLTGGASSSLSGIFFLPNADSFNLAGNGSLPIRLSAQFIATSLKVTGGATVYLVPNPYDSIEVVVYSTLLVR